MATVGIVGAGGFGREVMPLVPSNGTDTVVFVVEGDSSQQSVNGRPVIKLDDFIALPGERRFNIAIGNSRVRQRIAEVMCGAGCVPIDILASNTVNLAANQIGEGAVFCSFTTVTANARIGRFFHANIYSYVAHDCVIGDYVTFAPRVMCNGNVFVGDHAYIGTGAIIKQGSSAEPTVIGEGAVIGMGAVVTKSVPAGMVVVGNPAREMQRKGQ